MPTSGFCSILEKLKKFCPAGVVGFIDLRQILQSFGSDSEISSHTSVWLYPHQLRSPL